MTALHATASSTTPARAPLRGLVLLWLGWAALMLGYQALAPGRFAPQPPDHATAWTAAETRADSHKDQPYLLDPFLHAHVAWDSEYYISIALHGYDDPQMRALAPGSDLGAVTAGPKGAHPGWTSLNYAFFPGYPFAMRGAAWLLAPLRLDPVARAALAGVLVSLAGTLAALLAIADLAAAADGAAPGEGLRAAGYLLIWPASFFLAQVYTEGLFLGLSFGALALARRDRWIWAGGLAALATWTRSTGALLLLPLGWMWLAQGGLSRLRARPRPFPVQVESPEPDKKGLSSNAWSASGGETGIHFRLTRSRAGELVRLACVAAPAGAYLLWRAVFGARFEFVETHFFGRGLLWLQLTRNSWREAFDLVRSGQPEARAYYLVEIWGVAAGLAACVLLLRRNPPLALYGLAILAVALTSGAAQGMHRYALSLPALFLVPARLGRQPVFDRLWTLGNTLGMAVFALAFSYGWWAG